jgi:hypothetical protein
METVIGAIIVFVLLILTIINTILMISSSMTLIRIFEYLRASEERYQFAEEQKRQAKGLMDIATSQVPYGTPNPQIR